MLSLSLSLCLRHPALSLSLSLSGSLHFSFHSYIHRVLAASRSLSLSLSLSRSLSVCMSTHPSVHPSIHPYMCLRHAALSLSLSLARAPLSPSILSIQFGENPAHHQPFFALTTAAPLRDVVLGAPRQGGGLCASVPSGNRVGIFIVSIDHVLRHAAHLISQKSV